MHRSLLSFSLSFKHSHTLTHTLFHLTIAISIILKCNSHQKDLKCTEAAKNLLTLFSSEQVKNRFPDIEEQKLFWVSDNHKISCCHKNHLNTSQKNFAANNPFLLIILSKVETWNRLIFYLGVESFVWSVSSMRVCLLASFILLGQLSLLIIVRTQ